MPASLVYDAICVPLLCKLACQHLRSLPSSGLAFGSIARFALLPHRTGHSRSRSERWGSSALFKCGSGRIFVSADAGRRKTNHRWAHQSRFHPLSPRRTNNLDLGGKRESRPVMTPRGGQSGERRSGSPDTFRRIVQAAHVEVGDSANSRRQVGDRPGRMRRESTEPPDLWNGSDQNWGSSLRTYFGGRCRTVTAPCRGRFAPTASAPGRVPRPGRAGAARAADPVGRLQHARPCCAPTGDGEGPRHRTGRRAHVLIPRRGCAAWTSLDSPS